MSDTPDEKAIFDEIASQIAEKAKIDIATIQPQSTLKDMGVSSLDAIELLFDIEEHYGITFPDQGPNFGSDTVQQLVDVVKDALAAKTQG